MADNFKDTNPERGERDFFGRLRKLEDEVLVAKLAGGCDDALAVLFERHSTLVFRIARRILRDDGEAEESVQQVFLNICQAIDQFDAQKGTFKTWLVHFAYHRAINRREYLQRRRFYDSSELDEDILSGHPNSIGTFLQQSPQEMSHLIKQLLVTIKPKQREVIELAFFNGLTGAEIAERTGQSQSAVRHNLYRGLKKLRSVLLDRKRDPKKEKSDTEIANKVILLADRPPTL